MAKVQSFNYFCGDEGPLKKVPSPHVYCVLSFEASIFLYTEYIFVLPFSDPIPTEKGKFHCFRFIF